MYQCCTGTEHNVFTINQLKNGLKNNSCDKYKSDFIPSRSTDTTDITQFYMRNRMTDQNHISHCISRKPTRDLALSQGSRVLIVVSQRRQKMGALD